MRKLVFTLGVLIWAFFGTRIDAQALRNARITQPVDESQLQTLAGSTHPLARPEFDQGIAPPDLPMEHMLLALTRSSSQEAALRTLLAQQQDKSSPQFHRWLTPQRFGEQFGVSDEDIAAVSAWLKSHGFIVNRVSNGKAVIDFSGTAAQVAQAFHTQIHSYLVGGVAHWANSTDPQIPAALSPVIGGFATMHNFGKKPQLISSTHRFQAKYTPGKRPEFTSSSGQVALAPWDFSFLYNTLPLYPAGIDGTGITIAVVGRTDINISDINRFRRIFDLPKNPPKIVHNGPDPGNLGGAEEGEAVLDTSWAGAVAPGATIKLVVSQTTNSTDGVDFSALYIVDNNLADVMTESFGDCEAHYGRAAADYYSSLAAQAAAEGITYLVAAGDSGAEGCADPSNVPATGPLSVNILSSTPYTIAVGGTELNPYFNNANNSALGSALMPGPEWVWNDSCTATGQTACTGNNSPGLWAGGGGVSRFFPKPAWQAGVTGIPNDGARDVPDVSLAASGTVPYLLCIDGSCEPESNGVFYFQGYAGTSAATPSFAGIMALAAQAFGRQGQANQVLYLLAATEPSGYCDTSLGPRGNCIINDLTTGNNAVPGEAGYGTSSAKYQAGPGYDLASGLGSVNAANLVNEWAYGMPNLNPKFSVTCSSPGYQQSVFSGLAQLSGNALSPAGDPNIMAGVQISIDDVPYGAASVSPGTDFSGPSWSIFVDTTKLRNGLHALDVAAIDSSGSRGSTQCPFVVSNWTTADPMIIEIDNPAVNSAPFTGSVVFGGWAIETTSNPIQSVQIAVDGISYGNANYGGARPDVCTAYPVYPSCNNSGWSFLLHTGNLADGAHTLAVTGYIASGQNTTITRTFKTASGMTISIDRPGAGGSGPFNGAVGFGGWALDNNPGVSISNVAISIDGVFAGNAIYGNARNDVCAVFPGRTGCPNVGWTVLIDTSPFSNGTHTLQVEAIASNGQHATASAPFTIANAASSSPIKMSIDNPGPSNSVVTGLRRIAGFALDPNGRISSVSISVDGTSLGNATYGVARPDACAVFPNSASCPNVGWTLSFDSTLFPNGTHSISATASSSNGDVFTATDSFTIANWTTGNPMKITIDYPNSGSAPVSGTIGIGGWAISDISAIQNVAIAIDGVAYGNAVYGGNRPDVCRVYPGRAGCPNVGWYFTLNTNLLANGLHTLQVTATSAGGQNSTASTTFTVSNSSPVLVTIDVPTFGSALSGAAAISGWAIDTTGGVAIASVQILVDGVPLYNASYGVYSRPDVCAVFPGASGCPNVGWTSTIDTTMLTNGIHTLDVTATATNGQQATNSKAFLAEQ